jgi:4-amino-4-deoxy-L-arabinose transferase-like glycosyltransferase
MALFSRWRFLVALALVTRVAICMHTYFSDEATYAALAAKIQTGALPYVGAVDHKPPGIELVYTAVFTLCGHHLIAVRLLLVLVIASTATLLAATARRLCHDQAAAAAGVLYVLASTWGVAGDVQAANTELFLDLPLALAAWLITRSRRAMSLAGVGALTAVAALFKYQAALAGIGWAITVALDVALPARVRLARLVALAAAFVACAAAYVAVFVLAGAWSPLSFWGWQYSFEYIGAISAVSALGNALTSTVAVSACWLPLLLCIRRPDGELARIALPWLAAMALAIAQGGRFYGHYYLMALPPLVLLAARGLFACGRRARLARPLAAVTTFAALISSLIRPELDTYQRRGMRAAVDVGIWIRRHASRDARMFVWGNSPEIYVEADRVMGTRFPFCAYHTGKIWGTSYYGRDSPGSPALVVSRAWDELAQDLASHPPELVIDGAAARLKEFDRAHIANYPQLARLVATRYVLAAIVDGVPIYRLR